MFSDKQRKDNYLGVSLNLSPADAIKLINKTCETWSHQKEIILPNIGMRLCIDHSEPEKHYVQLGFHDDYHTFVQALDERFAPKFLRSYPGNRNNLGGITRCFGFNDSAGKNHQIWAIICGQSNSAIFDRYILAHEEGHLAMVFDHEKELIDTFLKGYPGLNRKMIENETNEFKAILAGLIPFASNTMKFNKLKQALNSFDLHMDKDHQKALYFAATCHPSSP